MYSIQSKLESPSSHPMITQKLWGRQHQSIHNQRLRESHHDVMDGHGWYIELGVSENRGKIKPAKSGWWFQHL